MTGVSLCVAKPFLRLTGMRLGDVENYAGDDDDGSSYRSLSIFLAPGARLCMLSHSILAITVCIIFLQLCKKKLPQTQRLKTTHLLPYSPGSQKYRISLMLGAARAGPSWRLPGEPVSLLQGGCMPSLAPDPFLALVQPLLSSHFLLFPFTFLPPSSEDACDCI